jgi:hypothetical protein
VAIGRADDGADDGAAVHHVGELGQHFADLQAGNFCVDGRELAADFSRGLGLEVEQILMGGSAAEEDVDDRLVSRRFSGGRFQTIQSGEAECTRADA